MSAVRASDILLRVSPRNLERFQSLAVAGSGRGRGVPLPYTFARADASTCATYWGSDGLLRLASANNLRVDDYGPYYEQGLVDSAGLPLHGIRLEGARTNVVLWNRDLTNAAWVKTNVTAAKDQTGIDGVASSASKITASAGNGTCLQSITLASSARFQSAFVKRITGTGTVNMTMDNGVTWTVITVTSTTAWSRVTIPTQTLANPIVGFRLVTSGDAIAVDFVQNENGAFQSNPIATTTVAVARAADAMTVPVNFGPMDKTVLAKCARPVWADAAGDIGFFPGIFSIGNGVEPHLQAYGIQTARQYQSAVSTTGADSFSPAASIPSGATQTVVAQFKNLTTGGQTAHDSGAGYGAFGSAAAAFSAYGAQTLRVGSRVAGSELYGVLLDLFPARGLFTHTEMSAVP